MTGNSSHKFDGTTWTSIAPLPEPLGGARAVSDGTNIYVVGGHSSGDPRNTLYKYDPVTNSYSTLAPCPTATFFHAAVYLSGKIYKFSGQEPFQVTNALEIYDIATNTWTGGANYPLAATNVSAFAHGNFIYGAGGYNAGTTAKTYRYEPATNTWDDAAIADLPAARHQGVAAFYNGGGVLAGGEVGPGPGGSTVTASVISWNPASDTWATLPSMLGGRTVATGAVMNGSFYVVGGRGQILGGQDLTSDNQKFTCTPGSGPTPTPSPTATPAGPPGTLANISTRLSVETGENVLIGGFIVTGTQPKRIIVRAIGPSLPVADALTDPVLELRDSSGGLIVSNDNWRTGGQEAEIIATTIPPSHDLEAAIVADLPANSSLYTAIVRGVDNGTGIGVVEVYDLDQTADSKLANISTRGFVQTANDVLIGGVIVLGQNPLRVIIRALGPSLPLTGGLVNPTLDLHDGNGSLFVTNDNWREDPVQEAEIIATGIPPSSDLESAIVRELPPGSYTAIVRGMHNAVGIAVVEVYGLN